MEHVESSSRQNDTESEDRPVSGSPHHLSPCRGMNCRTMMIETEMIAASRILGPGKRGWFCPECATMYRRLRRLDR